MNTKKIQYLVDVMSIGQKFIFYVLVGLWLATLVWFWVWWLQFDHIVTIFGIFITSYVVAYQTIIPLWFFWFAGLAKRPNMSLPLPKGRIAMMTTKVPSEPNEMIEHTLTAILAQNYPTPYDVWLAAEESWEDNPAIYAWCDSHGVGVTCRKGMTEFNRKTYPGQAKTKEGNTLSWYCMVGYNQYDFVVQLDADHAPTRSDYLRHMIAPFINPKVGLVAAPSMNDTNMNESWAARGRVYVETNVHGLMQAGYASWGTAMGIGSHYAVRTKALKEAGGPGPTRAEDAGTTLLINAAGYDSVFSINAEAHGEGPQSFGVAVTQELDWSISLVRLLIDWLPKVWNKLSLRKKIIFTFAFGWYPSFASHMTIGILIPVIALITGAPWMNMSYLDFLWRYWIFVVVTILPIWFIKINCWFRPSNAPLISWEAFVFQTIRWPWALAGCIAGTTASLFKSGYTFHITPKGKDKGRSLGLMSILPYLMIILISGCAIIMINYAGRAEGYRFLALLDIIVYTVALSVIVLRHFIEVSDLRSRLSGVPGALGSIISVLIVVAATITAVPKFAPVFAVAQTTQQDSQYVAVRSQIGPTQTPTIEPIPFFVEIPITIPFFPTPTPISVVELPKEKMWTGMYDPDGMFRDTHWDINHSFTDWNYPKQIDSAILTAQKAGQFPLITVEPNHRPGSDTSMLLKDIVNGKYDDIVLSMTNTIQKHAPQKVIIRWGHEMDLCGQREWSTCVEEDWIPAYRYVVDFARKEGLTNALWMWSPGGNSNARQFWPGPEYVDYIGVTILVSEDWDRKYKVEQPWPRPMSLALYYRNQNTAGFNKPLIIAEFGISYTDPNVDRTQWLIDAFNVMKDREKYPMLVGWVFYQGISQCQTCNVVLPDFRVSRNELFTALNAVGGF